VPVSRTKTGGKEKGQHCKARKEEEEATISFIILTVFKLRTWDAKQKEKVLYKPFLR